MAPASSSTAGAGRKRRREEDENSPDGDAQAGAGAAPKKKRASRTDRLVHHGRNFGRTISTFRSMLSLIDDGVTRTEQISNIGVDIAELEESEQNDQALFNALLKSTPGLEARLFSLERTEDDIVYVATMLQKGVNTARADDIKTLKSAVIDWITPAGGILSPALNRNSKLGRGFTHDVTGKFLCPTDYDWEEESVRNGLRGGQIVVTGLQWPRLMYQSLRCNPDDMWEGLMRGKILLQAYKHIFTSPSSVDGENRATRSGNAQIHGMTSVTIPSLVYVATLVRFSLSSAGSFSRTDTVTDSERFYNTLLGFLESLEEEKPVKELVDWWNKQVFPAHTPYGYRSIPKTCALAKLQAQRQKTTLGEVTNSNS